jgi:hypothetical protein
MNSIQQLWPHINDPFARIPVEVTPQLVDDWVSVTPRLPGESPTAHRFRVIQSRSEAYRKDRERQEQKRRLAIASTAPRLWARSDSTVTRFEEDLRAYSRRPNFDTAEALAWSTHNLRFECGDEQALRIWRRVRDRYRLRNLPSLEELQREWALRDYCDPDTLYYASWDADGYPRLRRVGS